MVDLLNFGPATIYFDDVDQGKTVGGGQLRLLTVKKEYVGAVHDVEEIVYGGEGRLEFFKWGQTAMISQENMDLTGYGELRIEQPEFSITLHRCKLKQDDRILFSTNVQKSYGVRLVFGPDDNGDVISLKGGSA